MNRLSKTIPRAAALHSGRVLSARPSQWHQLRAFASTQPALFTQEAYPLPDVHLLMKDMYDQIKPFYSPLKLAEYQSAVATLLPSAGPTTPVATAVQQAVQDLDNSKNWSDVWFTNMALVLRIPLSMVDKCAVKLAPPGSENWSQAEATARLLRAVALWHLHGSEALNERQKIFEWQLDGLKTFRYPAKGMDSVKEGARPDHSVVWRKGHPFKVNLTTSEGVLSVEAIQRQIEEILAWEGPSAEQSKPGFATMSWRLGRDEWAETLESFGALPENKQSLDSLYTSAITIALEDYETPKPLSKVLDDSRLGSTSINRFADQMLGAVVYPDGQTGVTYDHTVTDGGGMVELTRLFARLIEADSQYNSTSASLSPQPVPLTYPSNLPKAIETLPEKHNDVFPREVSTFQLEIDPEKHELCREGRLMDSIVNWTYQAGLRDIFNDWLGPVYQPVHQWKYVRGRTNLFQTVTRESLDLIQLLGQPAQERTDSEIAEAFDLAHNKRRRQIETGRDGRIQGFFRSAYIHPILEKIAVASTTTEQQSDPVSLSPKQTDALNNLLAFFRQQSAFDSSLSPSLSSEEAQDLSPGLQFSGFKLTDAYDDVAVEAVQANIWLPNMFMLTYLDRPRGRVDIVLNATGQRIPLMAELERRMGIWAKRLTDAGATYLANQNK